MNILEIIAKKRDGNKLTKEEIEYFIKEYTNNNITDYQAAALVMAIYINGMDEVEITDLTLAMANSGDILDLADISNNIIDKHSTGGVGDKVTLVLMPIIASLGLPVAKMSGRGLGITGGTIDKLESIPGYQTTCAVEEFKENVKKIGISLIAQTMNLAPADKKIYALRDTISCTESIPLIASSIMSKKLAAGSNKIVLDVTVGSGAFMKEEAQARKLADIMKRIGELAGKETVCILTDMDEPLGYGIGNVLEIKETIACLKGDIPEDVKEVIGTLGANILKLAGMGEDLQVNARKIIGNIENGKAFEKFRELVANQGGDTSYIENPDKLGKAAYIYPVSAKESGFVQRVDAGIIGEVVVELGAGRRKKEDTIDPLVGVVLQKKIGDKIEKGDILAFVHSNKEEKAKWAITEIERAFKVSKEDVTKKSKILR